MTDKVCVFANSSEEIATVLLLPLIFLNMYKSDNINY